LKIQNSKIKIALVHDYIKEFGGAEAVLEVLSDIFPDAPIYTSLYKPEYLGPHQNRLEKKWNKKIHQSFFQYIPFARKIISPLRLFSSLAFKSFNFSKYDLIISSATGAYFPNSLNKKKAKLICYCHTPPRYLYGLPTARKFTKNKLIKFIVNILNHFLRLKDFKYSQNVDQYIANSKTTAARIQKFYRRDSLIINPPIDLPKNINPTPNVQYPVFYFLTGGRLARAKRFDIAIKACNQLKIKLKIFGRDFSGVSDDLKKISGSTIEFLGEIDNQTRAQLYQQAKAFLFTAEQEDFGMVPVEAMSYGCPVIAYRSGGVTETVIENKTGVFFDKPTGQSCAKAIQKFQKLKIKPSDCISRASDFSTAKFKSKIKNLVSKT
jgi:glycosyltransferase involved in cell wall biosynthesis